MELSGNNLAKIMLPCTIYNSNLHQVYVLQSIINSSLRGQLATKLQKLNVIYRIIQIIAEIQIKNAFYNPVLLLLVAAIVQFRGL